MCAGLIAGWAILGVGDGVIAAFGEQMGIFETEEKAAAAAAKRQTTKQTTMLTPAETEAQRVLDEQAARRS